MKINVLGAAGGEVTGSAYYVQTKQAGVLVDCGLFQGGKKAEAKERSLGRMLGEILSTVSALGLAVLISSLFGCATKKPAGVAQPANGIEEYRQIATEALRA